ncbi:RNA polymerase sigma factor [Algoriphagus namhaensis]
MQNPNEAEEPELIEAIKLGDQKAFQVLYLRHIAQVLAFAQAFLKDPDQAEEAVQIIFIKIWEKRTRLQPHHSFKAYLFRAIKNHMINKLRDQKRHCSLEDIPMSKLELPTEEQEKELTTNLALHLIEELPDVQRTVFTLSRIDGMQNGEIADKLNLSKRTIEHHIYLATKSLRLKLKDRRSVLYAWISQWLFFVLS